MPRYGRTIPQVEDLKARADVTVVKITEDTRESQTESIFQELLARLGCEQTATELPSTPVEESEPEGHASQPCGPLMGIPSASGIPPRTLLLGLTGSPLPADPSMAYSERSFWKLVDEITGSGSSDPYAARTARAADLGLVMWDVLSDVHETGGGSNNKRKRKQQTPNDLHSFLSAQPTITTLAFNGSKAAAAAKKFMPSVVAQYKVVSWPHPT